MITFRINNHLRIRYSIEGIRLDLKYKGKWFSVKLNRKELELLELIIKTMSE